MISSKDTTEILAHASFKLRRAASHFEHLKRLTETFLSDIPHETTTFVSEDGYYVIRVSVSPKTMTTGIPLILADAIHNLQTVLDFALTEICARLIPNWQDTDRIHFPFDVTEQSLRNRVAQLVIKESLPDDIALLLTDTIRPWSEGNERHSASYALWALSKLDNRDKHKFLTPTVIISAISGLSGVSTDEHGAVTDRFEDNTCIVQAGTVMLPIASMHKIKITNTGQAQGILTFASDQFFPDEQVLPVIENLLKLVDGVLHTLREHLQVRDRHT